MPVPSRETVCPALTTVIARIPVGRARCPAIPAVAMPKPEGARRGDLGLPDSPEERAKHH